MLVLSVGIFWKNDGKRLRIVPTHAPVNRCALVTADNETETVSQWYSYRQYAGHVTGQVRDNNSSWRVYLITSHTRTRALGSQVGR